MFTIGKSSRRLLSFALCFVLIAAAFVVFTPKSLAAGSYTLTIRSYVGGSYTTTSTGSYDAGETISLYTEQYDGNYRFVRWESSGGGTFTRSRTTRSNSFRMPSNDATVTAVYEYRDSYYYSDRYYDYYDRYDDYYSGRGYYNRDRYGRYDDDYYYYYYGGDSYYRFNGRYATAADRLEAINNSQVVSGTIDAANVTSKVTSAIDNSSESTNLTVRYINQAKITTDAIRALSSSAKGRTVTLNADTTYTDNNTDVQGRLALNSSVLSGYNGGEIQLGVYVESKQTSNTKTRFNNYYSNNIAVIHMDHVGSLGGRAEVVAKASLSGLDTSNLVFYVYNKSNNSYDRIQEPNYSIDNAGYLHFYTSTAGDIIVTDSALTVK